MTNRAIVAEFHKSAGKRLRLWSLTSIEEETGRDGRKCWSRTTYDVEFSRKYGYLFSQSGAGGSGPVAVEGIYFASGDVLVKECPCSLVDPSDKEPWRGKKTKAIRARNRTRRLRAIPKAFDLGSGHDLLDWLNHKAIEGDAVYCSTCDDYFPGDDLCDHCWWCYKIGWWSTPSDRCKCTSREECSD